ncbi:MICOS complex subunit MIC19-like isoform X3 [Senna tora]|uniref:MICOS complex subunit MIC19-like isoform X3 n=1 Tax=Senna tora TaxID=362788 RepID=A0A834WPA2_9FABA|nr:MICOS complex subunit MIC19-like isoform X3 [Senna tora]
MRLAGHCLPLPCTSTTLSWKFLCPPPEANRFLLQHLPPQIGTLLRSNHIMGQFTIQLSTNLISRLVHDAEASKKKTKRTKRKAPVEPPISQSNASEKHVEDDSGSGKPKSVAAPAWPLQPPLFLPVTPPVQSANVELEAIRSVLQESEKIVERLQKQEENMLQEVTQKARDLSDKEYKLPKPKPKPCTAESDACFACYKEHAKDPLKCASLVTNFAECVRRFRQQAGLTEK